MIFREAEKIFSLPPMSWKDASRINAELPIKNTGKMIQIYEGDIGRCKILELIAIASKKNVTKDQVS